MKTALPVANDSKARRRQKTRLKFKATQPALLVSRIGRKFALPKHPYVRRALHKAGSRVDYGKNVEGVNMNPAFFDPSLSRDELIAWAWENGRADVLAQFGIFADFGM